MTGFFAAEKRSHGFVLSHGVRTLIDFPNKGTFPFGINNQGQVVGTYADTSQNHGFLWSHGKFAQIDDPTC